VARVRISSFMTPRPLDILPLALMERALF